MERTGKCLCGAVSYRATDVGPKLTACHCDMCLRWTGGPLFAVSGKDVVWHGEDHIKCFTSSAWAERGFCTECGSALFYRVTAPGPHQGHVTLAFGTLDDKSGLELQTEWFIDKKPDAYTLSGEHRTVTEAEAFAMFGGG